MDSISRTELLRAYRRYAPLYDLLFGAVLEPGRRELANEVRRLAPASLLEVGVGTGLTLSRYPAETAVVGIDVSIEMLARAKPRACADGRTVLAAMDAEALALPDGTFDCVAVPYVLSVTPNPAKLVAELRRVCRPGGVILILNHFSGAAFWHFAERSVRSLASRVGFRSEFDFESQVLAYDWQVESVKPVNLFGLSKLVVIRNTSVPGARTASG